MVNTDILKMAEQLQNMVRDQMAQARKALADLPEGPTKKALSDLMRKAATGKMSQEDLQNELEKIISDAR